MKPPKRKPPASGPTSAAPLRRTDPKGERDVQVTVSMPEQTDAIRAARDAGKSYKVIAEELGLSVTTVRDWLRTVHVANRKSKFATLKLELSRVRDKQLALPLRLPEQRRRRDPLLEKLVPKRRGKR